jgi:hypothetical protein
MSDDSHRALKRWERAKQLAAVRSDPDLIGPAANCRVHSIGVDQGEASVPLRVPVFIVAMFAKDLTCVKACREPLPPGLSGACWLVRGGIRWEDYLRAIVTHYGAGLPVPAQFQPTGKIASEIITHLKALPDSLLPSVFSKLRDSGLLPGLPALSRETCPLALPWENIRACFQDFLEGG